MIPILDSLHANRNRDDYSLCRAKVSMPVTRLYKMLKKGHFAKRVGVGAPVYLAGVLDYLVSEILDMATDAARDNKKKRITERHIMLAVRRDDELGPLLNNVIIANSGVTPNIIPLLLPKNSKKKGDVAEEGVEQPSEVSSATKDQDDDEGGEESVADSSANNQISQDF